MKNKSTISMVFSDEYATNNKIIPPIESIKSKITEVSKDTLKHSLRDLITDIGEILNDIDHKNTSLNLRQISVAVQFNTEGGVTWIAYAKTGITNSMTLTFEIREPSDG